MHEDQEFRSIIKIVVSELIDEIKLECKQNLNKSFQELYEMFDDKFQIIKRVAMNQNITLQTNLDDIIVSVLESDHYESNPNIYLYEKESTDEDCCWEVNINDHGRL